MSAKPKPLSKPKLAAPEPLDTLTKFIDRVTAYAATDGQLRCYRGQLDASWKAAPALLRPDRVRLEHNERFAVRDLMAVHPREFAEDTTMFDRLVRMQHFHLPTRLMDVSLNPLVALYFATEPVEKELPETDGVVTAFLIPKEREKYYDSDAVSCIANLANLSRAEKKAIVDLRDAGWEPVQENDDRREAASGSPRKPKAKETEDERLQRFGDEAYHQLVQFVRAEKPYFLPRIEPIDLFKPFYVHPKMSNRRIIAQAGGFIVYGLTPKRDIRFRYKLVETQFVIPGSAKEPIRRSLELLGINDSTLFPELDRAAKRIGAKYSV